ncbi:hypothetical protein FRC01_002515 [Tulasnella sp. 417]|nr:hypothetical protein FRC01_002515 [Tulasnella sp. 417]
MAGAAVATGVGVTAVLGAVLISKEEKARAQHEAQLQAIDARTRKDKAYWISWHMRRPGVSRHLDPLSRPLRLLSLEQIMNEVAPGAKPCEWFDLIGGTSTGGLIAIMLGRLRMSIPDCIEAYRQLSKEVFDVNTLNLARNIIDGHRFSGDRLQRAVEKVVAQYKGRTSTKMWDNPENRSPRERVCRTLVHNLLHFMATAAGVVAGVGATAVLGAVLVSKEEKRRAQHQAQLKAIDDRTRKDKAYWIAWHQRRPGISRHLDPLSRPLRLLSLEQIMNEVAPGAKPCEWFDLIGGTSTGGLIAIMLGRLRMSIRDCIEAYRELSKEVFDINALNVAINILDGHRFSGGRLQSAVEKVVDQYKGRTSTKMWDNPENRSGRERVCRTFVVAIPGCDVHRPAKLFRTYNNRFQRHSADHCQIWEAARATSCAPSFFPEVQVDGVYYSDGGLGYNNPTKLMLQEAQSLWGPDQKIGCLLSLGTGSVDSFMKRVNGPLDLLGFVGIFKRMALSCDGVHQEMRSNQLLSPFYYRFNPTMKENISLDEWKKLEDLEEIANNYLYATRKKVAAFASAMVAYK